MTWESELSLAVRLGEAAADKIASSAQSEPLIARKVGSDIVTDVDYAAEQLILDGIRHDFPSDAVHAEESGEAAGPSGRKWVIDPLDGTVNFAAGLPHFGVSIAFEVEELVRVGVVIDASRSETFVADEHTALCNNSPIQVSRIDAVRDAVIALQVPEPLWRERKELVRSVEAARGFRVTGSTALDLAWTAKGIFDACIYRRTASRWDWLAGERLVLSAGGVLTSLGILGDFEFMVAANSELAASIRLV